MHICISPCEGGAPLISSNFRFFLFFPFSARWCSTPTAAPRSTSPAPWWTVPCCIYVYIYIYTNIYSYMYIYRVYPMLTNSFSFLFLFSLLGDALFERRRHARPLRPRDGPRPAARGRLLQVALLPRPRRRLPHAHAAEHRIPRLRRPPGTDIYRYR